MKRIVRISFRKLSIFVIVLTVIAAVAGIILPGVILKAQGSSDYGIIKNVPEEYYSSVSAAMARNASANLNDYQRLQLISGRWESKISDVSAYEMELQDYEAVKIIRDALGKLNEEGIYPESIFSDYANWYNWRGAAHKAVDTTFHTYTAYYWEIDFYKYDSEETHKVYVLEDGLVFYAEADLVSNIETELITPEYMYLQNQNIEAESVPVTGTTINELLTYPGIDLTGLEWLDRTQTVADTDADAETPDIYEYVQAYNGNRYVYALIPELSK